MARQPMQVDLQEDVVMGQEPDAPATGREVCTPGTLAHLGLTPTENAGEGNCLFLALADAFSVQKIALGVTAKAIRSHVAEFLHTRPEAFVDKWDGLALNCGDEDEPGRGQISWPEYCSAMMRPGTWGGTPELLAAAAFWNLEFVVLNLWKVNGGAWHWEGNRLAGVCCLALSLACPDSHAGTACETPPLRPFDSLVLPLYLGSIEPGWRAW